MVIDERRDIQWAIKQLVNGDQVRRKAWPVATRRVYTRSGDLLLEESAPSGKGDVRAGYCNAFRNPTVYPFTIEDLLSTDWERYNEEDVRDAMAEVERKMDKMRERVVELKTAVFREEATLEYIKKGYEKTYKGV